MSPRGHRLERQSFVSAMAMITGRNYVIVDVQTDGLEYRHSPTINLGKKGLSKTSTTSEKNDIV